MRQDVRSPFLLRLKGCVRRSVPGIRDSWDNGNDFESAQTTMYTAYYSSRTTPGYLHNPDESSLEIFF